MRSAFHTDRDHSPLLKYDASGCAVLTFQVAKFREKFVNHNSRKTRDAEREPVPPSPIRSIYVRKVKRGPLGVLAAELRYFLPVQCCSGSIFLRKGLSGDAGRRIYGRVYKKDTNPSGISTGKGQEPSQLQRSPKKC